MNKIDNITSNGKEVSWGDKYLGSFAKLETSLRHYKVTYDPKNIPVSSSGFLSVNQMKNVIEDVKKAVGDNRQVMFIDTNPSPHANVRMRSGEEVEETIIVAKGKFTNKTVETAEEIEKKANTPHL